jgi:hypothetical protein
MRVPPRKILVLAVLAAALLALLFALLHGLSALNFLRGLNQSTGVPKQGPLPGVDWQERWHELPPEQLSFWACANAAFPNGFAQGALQFENSPASRYTLVFELTARVDGKSTVIYRSPPLPPGWHLDGAKLLCRLKQGVYAAQCVAYAYEDAAAPPVARALAQEMVVTILE